MIAKQIKSLGADMAGAFRLAGDAHSFLRLSVDFLLFRLMRIVNVPLAGRERRIRFRDGSVLYYRLNRADIYTIHEVWIEEMYRLPVEKTLETIVDLGANIGFAGLWLAKKYGCRQMIAVEPSPENARLAAKNLAANRIPAQVVEAAVGGHDGHVTFDVGPGSTCGRVVDSEVRSSLTPNQYQVRMVSMASLIPEDAQIDLVKLDIEGGEQDLLCGDAAWLGQVNAFIAEFHHQLVDYPSLVQVLQKAGFKRVSHQVADMEQGNTLEYLQRSGA